MSLSEKELNAICECGHRVGAHHADDKGNRVECGAILGTREINGKVTQITCECKEPKPE